MATKVIDMMEGNHTIPYQ